MSSPAERPRPSRTLDEDSQTGRTLLNLREMLLRGDFRPGERLSELPLVARLGVSRTPLRLALDRLANEGLLEVVPSGGFVVRSFTLTDIWDAIEMRGVLEGSAARLAAERLTDASELSVLRTFKDEMEAVVDLNLDTFPRYLDLNESFHWAIVDLAKSPMLRRTLEHVTRLPFASASALLFTRSMLPRAGEMFTVGQDQHRSIFEAIEHREGARAEDLAREHARLSRRNLQFALAHQDVFSRVPGASLIKTA